ncbi:hypothetical protein GCM10010106_17220 [Thermopolyspora flexuosa]|nr:hypothetical protein GCM10010106_17220 [Thermopolyspora flexuosa]
MLRGTLTRVSSRVRGMRIAVARLRSAQGRHARSQSFGLTWLHLTERPLLRVRHFTATPEQVGQARTFARRVVGERHPRLHDVVLVVSELAGNAVRHGGQGPGREFEVSVVLGDDSVVVAVRDSGLSGTPHLRSCDIDCDSGRGLALVAMAARRWGFHRDPAGTVVWAELDARPLPD